MNEFLIQKTTSNDISSLRELFLAEGGFQFIHNKCHHYGWADAYVFLHDNNRIGYGSVWGKDNRQDRDTIFEFYLIPDYRKYDSLIFREFVKASGVSGMECQTNDTLLASMMFEHAEDIHAQSVLFEDDVEKDLRVKGAVFNRQSYATNHPDDCGGYGVEKDGEVVATGGFMLNYNPPFADIYLDVKEPYRKCGIGSFMVQELKKEIYKAQRVPAARCNVKNLASRATLLKAGFRLCGYLLEGKVKNSTDSQSP